jgi:acetylornithine/succinyldiaminopimelate/putrescine aminotransferase
LQREKVLANVRRVGRYFRRQLEQLKARHACVAEIRNAGLMVGVSLKFHGKEVVDECLARRLIINCTHDTVLRFLPPFTISERQVDDAIGVLDAALSVAEQKQCGPGLRPVPHRPVPQTSAQAAGVGR